MAPAALGATPKAAGIGPFQGDANEWAATMITSSIVGRIGPFQADVNEWAATMITSSIVGRIGPFQGDKVIEFV